MRKGRALVLSAVFGLFRLAAEDLDALVRVLPLPSSGNLVGGEAEGGAEVPLPRDLRAGLDEAPGVVLPSPAEEGGEVEAAGLVRVELPMGPLLVAANPVRLDEAWRLLGRTAREAGLVPVPPLLVLLHADGNFSAGCPLRADAPVALPQGADISPHPGGVLHGVWAEIPEARRDHPAVLAAYQRLRALLDEKGLRPDTREIYFLPGSRGWVLIALRTDAPLQSRGKPVR